MSVGSGKPFQGLIRYARSIIAVLTHPFGVGNAQFRLGIDQPKEVDTVPFGCFPKAVFERYGYYDERLHRNQDIELNKRIVRQGGKILLIPSVSSKYFARSDWKSLWKNNAANGKWVILTAYYTKSLSSLSLRHFAPLVFVAYWILLFLLPFTPFFFWWMILPGLAYLLLIGYASIKIGLTGFNFLLIPNIFITFLCLHFSYGLGSLSGLAALSGMKKK